ncbi:hypothetical protein [Paraclostridium bifermentans]|uniref:hypothetical protein n=2 Tax=Bacillota TaxID=1239 RepID=UPI001F27E666|nr:hypothetical protein [Paraclostridium bifermentans]MCE9674763.1 hypothetical protein [Paraclostridium bifermentans]GKZ04246.1 membrane protein [Paraclostridium bifermentans]GKZ05307.1 membrane protein [Paraclostridium bifermentans]GKZ11012.1 membrane protein [Paraclostridium bifermentans]
MKKKATSLVLMLIMLICITPINAFANSNHKTIVINMNRSNFVDFLEIPTLKKQLENRGYIALMNVRGDQGTGDNRSYASIGAGGRVNTYSTDFRGFKDVDKDNKITYESATGKKAKGINDTDINLSINDNLDKGKYGSTLGELGQTLNNENLSVSVLGNADIGTKPEELNRNIAAMAMDNYGRIDSGNVDNINKKDDSMPFGLSTDYNKLKNETKNQYDNSDIVFVELGDTYRLDLYKPYLNENTYKSMEKKIHKNIDEYLKEVFSLVDENDTVYVMSAFPKDIDYKNKRRLSPVVKFDGTGKGLLTSATTRRDGVIGNVDIGAGILADYKLTSNNMVGRELENIKNEDNINFLEKEYSKIVNISDVRSGIIQFFINSTSIVLGLSIVLLIFRKKLENKYNKSIKKAFNLLKELSKFGLIMPVAFLLAPMFNFNTKIGIYLSILALTLFIYFISRLIFKSDNKQIGFYATLSIFVIIVDALLGSYLMKNSIMSYDAIVGARYYGIGNEYQGIIIGSSIAAMSILIINKKLPKIIVPILSLIILFISASPTMGANVGSAISESVALILFTMLVFNVKIDFKKAILILFGAGLVVLGFAAIDMLSGSESHLSLFINQILVNGPTAILETFGRKISMNIQLMQNSSWVYIIYVGVIGLIVTSIFYKKEFKEMMKNESYGKKAIVSIGAGAIVTFLVNDSGVVSAATTMLYIIIPFLIILINKVIFKER